MSMDPLGDASGPGDAIPAKILALRASKVSAGCDLSPGTAGAAEGVAI